MAKDYTPIFHDWIEVTRELNAQEKGRLIDAIVLYDMGGDWQEQIKGNERYVFPGYQVRIDRWNEISGIRAQAGRNKQTETNSIKTEQNEAKGSKTPKDIVKEEEIKEVVVEDNAPAREEGPFGLTEEDVHASLTRDRQIDEAARSVGLQTTEAGMMRGRRLAEQYGTDALLAAIPLAVDRPTWAYVEGILRNGGKNSGHRGNHSKPDGEIRTDYEFLRAGAV